jgi:nitroimidazol reductase NimA-like FMN-containing flavoprotein (pyridoxamine 5'-phosphate oxidase superfamily)
VKRFAAERLLSVRNDPEGIETMAEPGSMTVEERTAFLAGLHVGVLAVDEPGRGPHSLPIWYLYEDGEVLIGIDGPSRKAALLRAAGRATMTVQTETAPYNYVSIEGPVALEPASHDELELAVRYLGDEIGPWYVENNPRTPDSVTVRLRPEHWRTFDFARLF